MAPNFEIDDGFDDSALWGALDNVPAARALPPHQRRHTTQPAHRPGPPGVQPPPHHPPRHPGEADQNHDQRKGSVGIDLSNYQNVRASHVPAPPVPKRPVRVELTLCASEHRVQVCLPNGWYDEGFANLCRGIDSCAFDGVSKRWSFADENLHRAVRQIKSSTQFAVDLVMPSPIATRALLAMAEIEKALAREAEARTCGDLDGFDSRRTQTHTNRDVAKASATQTSELSEIAASVDVHSTECRGALGSVVVPKPSTLPLPGVDPGTGREGPVGAQPRCAKTLAKRTVDELYASIPAHIRDTMFPFQREGVRFALGKGGRCLIGDQMGLGKTVQALACAAAYKDEWPCLILVPTSLRGAWEQALVKWLGDSLLAPCKGMVRNANNANNSFIAAVGTGAEQKKLDAPNVKFAIVPYSLVTKMSDLLLHKQYKVVICDESHFLKDSKAQRTKAVIPLLKNATRALCLTGTPALSRPVEIFSQAEALRPVVFTKFNEFAQRYCAGSRFGWNGSSNPGELHAVLSRLVMIRRLKKDVLTELPAKVREKIVISLQSGEAVTKVKAIRQRMQQMRDDNGGQGGNSMEEKRLMNELYQQSAFAKCRPVAEYVETLLDSSAGGAGDDDDQKFLFFGHHTCMLDSVSEMLRKRKIQFIRIDGSTPSDTRQSLVDKFQNDAHTRVAVLSIKAAGMGLTLTAASVVVFGELSWTPGDIVQAEDRAHRIGQRSCVNVQFLCAKNTVDDIMWGSISNKLETLGQVLDGQKGDTLMLKHAGKGRPAFERTREQRLETLISFGDRSPGGRFVDKPFGFVDGETNGATPKKQATLDAFVAKKPQQPSEKKWAPPPDWDDFDDDSLLHALEANPGKRPRGE